MRTALILIALCFVQARGVEKPFEFNVTYHGIKDAKEIIGKWTFSEQWSGFMGMAIEFKEHEFRYWFYSDVKLPDEPKYPVVGTWEVVKGVVVLKAPEGVHLYSGEWVMTKFGESIGLTNPSDVKGLICQKASPDSRMLTKLNGEPPIWPMLNSPGPWRKSAQQAADGKTPKADPQPPR